MANRPINIVAKDDQNKLQVATEFLLQPSFLNAEVINNFKGNLSEELIDLQYTQELIDKSIKEIKKEDYSKIEEMLFSQAFSLNVVFTSLAKRASSQDYITNLQLLMNLALKAQNQSRATLQTLIDLKQPSQTTFVKQANIANGHQQVNNQVENKSILQNELLEESYGSPQMDIRAKTKAERSNPEVEALGTIHRGKDTRGKG